MLFLEEFWYGNISPGEERCRPNSEYSKAFREMEKCENQLKEKLDAEGWETFQQFTKAQMEASSLSDCDSFISGFRLGAKVIMDVLLTPSVLK